MEKIKTELEGAYILKEKRFGDSRGFFESTTIKELKDLGFNTIEQVSKSLSHKGTFRGLHFQNPPYTQAKVVRCIKGKVLDIIVDMRKDSKTYGKYICVELSQKEDNMLYVPRGFAHGFLSLKDNTIFEYFVDNSYNPKYEDGISYNDPNLNIDLESIMTRYKINKLELSDKDKNRKNLKDLDTEFYIKPKKFLITGAKGQLGYDIINELEKRGEFNYLGIDIDSLDITDREKTIELIKKYNPDVIFHCAAYTNVDKAEIEKDLAYKINVIGTKNVSDAAKLVNAKILYMSTDYIFDGTKDGLYTENDKPNPLNVYGFTKLKGEEEILTNPKHFITRISWVFGINGKNFIQTMLKLSNTYDELNVVDDQIGSPTYTKDLAKLLVEMSYTDKYGIYNVTNDNYCSWATFANYIMEINDKKTKINYVSTEEYIKLSKSNQAVRPRNSKLSKDKLVENGFTMLPDYEDATKRYCKELKKRLYF